MTHYRPDCLVLPVRRLCRRYSAGPHGSRWLKSSLAAPRRAHYIYDNARRQTDAFIAQAGRIAKDPTYPDFAEVEEHRRAAVAVKESRSAVLY